MDQNIVLTDEQKRLIQELKQWYFHKSKPYYSYSGPPGTGKTTIIRALVEELHLKEDEFITAAYVGKAVLVLLRKGLRASTLHSLIYNTYIEEIKPTINSCEKSKFKLKFILKEQLDPNLKLIIIDEATMVNDKMKDLVLSFGIPVIFLGDINQLPPVFGVSTVMLRPDFILTQLMRQKEDDPIVMFTQMILRGEPIRTGIYGASKVVDYYPIDKTLLTDYDIIICKKNKTREMLNQKIRSDILKRSSIDPVISDKLICRQNNRDQYIDGFFLTNGLIGYIDSIDKSSLYKGYITIDFRPDFLEDVAFENVELDYKYIRLDYSERNSYGMSSFNKFEYGYAITSHLCIPKDTLIYTEDGIIELGKLKNYHGKVYNGAEWETSSKYIDNGMDKVNVFTLSNKTTYSVTDYHKCKILTNDGIVTRYGKDIQIGDEFLLRVGQDLYKDQMYIFELNNKIYKSGTQLYNIPNKLTNELSLLIGMICADGTITKYSIRYHKKDLDCINTFAKYAKDIFDCTPNIKKLKYENCWICEIHSIQIRDFFYNMKGLRPNKKYVPECIMKGSTSNQCLFLKGLFEDGCVHLKKQKFDMIALTFKGNKMINQLNVILSNIGISPTFAKVTKKKSILNNMYIFKSDAYIFKEKIGFITYNKQKRLNNINFQYSKTGSKILAQIVLTNYKRGDNKNINNLKRGGVLTYHAFLKIYDSLPLEEQMSDWVAFIKEIFENFKLLKVINIQEGYDDTACLEMTESHEFLQNGILGGNSQGSEYDNVLFIDEFFWDKELNKKSSYTAVSRAKEGITIVKCIKKELR